MKKIILLATFAVIILPAAVFSQENEIFIKGKSVGVMITNLVTHNFTQSNSRQMFTQNCTVAPSLNILTQRTYDHIMYDLGNNNAETLHSWLLPKNWDTYIFLSKNLATKDAYGSIGIEKVLPATENLEFAFFWEFGTNFFGLQSTTVGIITHPQFLLQRSAQTKK